MAGACDRLWFCVGGALLYRKEQTCDFSPSTLEFAGRFSAFLSSAYWKNEILGCSSVPSVLLRGDG